MTVQPTYAMPLSIADALRRLESEMTVNLTKPVNLTKRVPVTRISYRHPARHWTGAIVSYRHPAR